MITWFVTRHPGALDWARESGISVRDSRIVQDLNPQDVASGDVVVGTLPVHLAAQVSARGARYLHLTLDVPSHLRGRELTAQDMRECGARVVEYAVHQSGTPEVALLAPGSSGNCEDTQDVMICIASGQPQANFLPLFMPQRIRAVCVVQSNSDQPRIRQQIEQTSSRLQSTASLHNLPYEIKPNAPSGPLADVERFADTLFAELRQRYPNTRLVLNATGGTKLMSAGFANRLSAADEVIYCDTEHDRIEYFAPKGKTACVMPADLMRLDGLMYIQGIEKIRADSDDPDWMTRARGRIGLSKRLASFRQEWVYGVINYLAASAEPVVRNGNVIKQFQPNQLLNRKLTPAGKALFGDIATAGIWTYNANEEVCFVDEHAVHYLKGGWLEELLAVEMEKLCKEHQIPPGHWAAGIEVRPVNAASARDKPFNEIDLAVVWRNRLLLIECKTGTQGGDEFKGMDIVNKLDAIGQYLGGPFSSIWLASARSIPQESVAAERCKHAGVRIINPNELQNVGKLISEELRLR